MDPNNSQFILEDELNESNFTEVSSNATEMKKMADKIKKLEDMAVKNAKGSSNGDQSGMMFWQMGEKFGKMELKMDGISKENVELKEGMAKMMKHFEELKGENAEKDREIEGMKKKNIDRIVKMMKDFEELKGEVEKLSEENGKLKEENSEKSKEMEWMKKVIVELKEQNGEMKEELAGNARVMREMQKKIAKLIMQIDGHYIEMEERIFENSHKIEELERSFNRMKNGNGIGAKNAELQGQIGELAKLTEQIGGNEWVKYDWHLFKFNEMKCTTKLTISEGGLLAKHSVPPNYTWNSVRTFWPIPTLNNFGSIITKSTFAFYFETEILNPNYGIVIGFCGQEFSMEGKWLGQENNSIGNCQKGGIYIDGTFTKFGNANGNFINGDVIGLGIIYKPNSKMECFATYNGKLLGKAEIPSKFANCQLYPAVSLYYAGESVRLNFDKENCKFKEFERILQ